MRRIALSGTIFECTAKPWPWTHGHGVQIDITTSGKCVGCLLVLCAFDQPDFHKLASLSPPELCDLSLSSFTDEQLSAKIEMVLKSQEAIASLGFDDISPIGTQFPRASVSETGS